VDIRVQCDDDSARVEKLVELAFGGHHYDRAVWRLRPGAPVAGLCLVASDYRRIVGSLRFWEIQVAGQPQLLLGPLAVLPELQGRGFGRGLVSDGLRRAEQTRKWNYVFLSGDPDYYRRFGFYQPADGQFLWPGPLAPNRLLIRPLKKRNLQILPPGPAAILARLHQPAEAV